MSQTTVLIEQIHIGDRFRKDMGDISTLAKSIGDLGLLQPIVISENYQLIAGHRRLEACKSLGWIEVSVNIVNLADIIRGEFDENAMRKDFTISEMVAIKRNLEPVEREQAAERQHAGRPSEESAGGDVRERIASSLGVSHDTLKKAEVIVAAAEHDPEKHGPLLDKVDRKEVSVNQAYRELEPKSVRPRMPKNFVMLPESLYEQMCDAVDEAAASGKKQIKMVTDGHTVLHIGEAKVEIATT